MKSLIVGATAGLGRSIVYELASKNHDLFLIGTDIRDLNAICNDVYYKFKVKCNVLSYNLAVLDHNFKNKIKHWGIPQNIFLIAGSFVDDDAYNIGLDVLEKLIRINFEAPLKIINFYHNEIANDSISNIIGIGTVASIRPRNTSIVYASSKSGLYFYLRAMSHLFIKSKCKFQYYHLGLMETNMTFGKKTLLPTVNPERIARKICKNMGKNCIGKYLPHWWLFISIILNLIPGFIFKRMTLK